MTKSAEQIVIELSKTKLILMTFGSLFFVWLGFMFVINSEKYTYLTIINPTGSFIVGLVIVLISIYYLISFVKKITDNSPGLVISDKEIFDNSNIVSMGEIFWTDINYIAVCEAQNQKLILLHVKNSEDYIKKQKNSLKRIKLKISLKMYGTPLSINSNMLEISFEELYSSLENKLKTSQQ